MNCFDCLNKTPSVLIVHVERYRRYNVAVDFVQKSGIKRVHHFTVSSVSYGKCFHLSYPVILPLVIGYFETNDFKINYF